ncbi:hypothetical protein COMA2_310006 [Candidatus Nitrospira nitrificans]|uniref:Uncharacterized protein n=1 Tax=Candidatus Nitrospira nitrificans TaxID=1742973 RepID=A0A0S4LLW2_9BACT|nr:hypothetical protein COMA2_310006 [Candidatus Nitrospira nitrificans]
MVPSLLDGLVQPHNAANLLFVLPVRELRMKQGPRITTTCALLKKASEWCTCLQIRNALQEMVRHIEAQADASVLVRVVAPENWVPPSSAEAEDAILSHGPRPPSSKPPSRNSIGELYAQELKWVIEIGEAGNLQATTLQVVNRVAGGQEMVDSHSIPR